MEAATIAVLVITGAFLGSLRMDRMALEAASRQCSARGTNGRGPGSHRTRNITGKLSAQETVEELSQ